MSYARELQAKQVLVRNRLNSIGRIVPQRQSRLNFVDPEILLLRRIIKVVCIYYGWEVRQVLEGRSRKMSFIKHQIFFLAHYMKRIPCDKVAKYCGHEGYHARNVTYGALKVFKKLGKDLNCSAHMQELRKRLGF